MAKAQMKMTFEQLFELLYGHYIDCYTSGGKDHPTPVGMPSTVNILGQHYSVRYHTRIYAKNDKKRFDRLRGIIIFTHRLIIIDPAQSVHEMRETLYHEMAHLYLKDWQEKSPTLAKLTEAQEEEVCDLFAASLYDSLLNGPKL